MFPKFDTKRVDEVLDKLTGLNSSDKLSQIDIANVVRGIECLFTENAKKLHLVFANRIEKRKCHAMLLNPGTSKPIINNKI